MKRNKLLAKIAFILFLFVYLNFIATQYLVSAEPSGWQDDARLTDDPDNSTRPDIAVDNSDCLHVVWTDHKDPIGTYYKKFNGIDWGSEDFLGNFHFPTICSDSQDIVHVGFVETLMDCQIYYTKNDGNSWSDPLRVTLNSGYSVAWAPKIGPRIITNSMQYVYIFWTDSTDSDSRDISYVFFNGNVWSLKQYATNDPATDVNHFNQDVAVDSNDNLHMVYTTTEPAGGGGSNYLIHYKKFDGDSWSEQKLIGGGYIGYFVGSPSITIDSQDNVHIVWTDGRDAPPEEQDRYDIYYEKLDKDGNVLISEKRITVTDVQYGSCWSVIEVDNHDDLHMVWDRRPDMYDFQLYYKKMDNNGVNITGDVYLSENYQDSLTTFAHPACAVDSLNRAHIVFGDDRDGNQEIYYKGSFSQDLSILGSDIGFSNDLPKSNENFYINATIHNTGEILTNGTINIYKNNLDDENLIGSKSVSIPSSEMDIINLLWSAPSGAYNILILIEPEIIVAEANVSNNIANKTIIINDPPTITTTAPPSGITTIDDSYTITWIANDPDDDADIELFYDDDNVGNDGTQITTTDQYPSGLVDNDGASQSYSWDTSALTDGSSYYIYAKIDDGIHVHVYSYSQGKVKIDHQYVPPQVEITSPTGGTVSDTITIEGTAHDEDGDVQVVQIQIDNKGWVDAQGTTNWNLEWDTTSTTNGEHTIKARARDDTNLYSQEKSVTVTVDNGGNLVPSVKFTYPLGMEVVSGNIQIAGTALDSDGTVELVEIKVDDENWETASGTSSWSYPWDTTTITNGEHVIYARARDDFEEYSLEKSIILIVDNGGNIPPVVTIISPAGETVSGNVMISGSASDMNGDDTIWPVEVKIDEDDWENVDGITEWTYEWDTTSLNDGNHTIYARAYDDIDYSMVKSVVVFVDNPHEPTLTILSEIPKEVSGTFTIRISTFDIDGEITKVEIQVDNGQWKEIPGPTDWRYELDTTILSDGEHTLKIRAHDDEGLYDEETFQITVKNTDWTFLLILAGIIIVIVLSLIAGVILKKKKGKP